MNAIILAAGLGSRIQLFAQNKPKPLLDVNGIIIIERQINFLREKNINEIYIVVGYLHQHFFYLTNKYGVKLIYNANYKTWNNIYSLFVSQDFFENSYVIEGDVFLTRNFFSSSIVNSTYFTGIKYKIKNDWVLQFDSHLRKIIIPDINENKLDDSIGKYIMSGISFWNKQDSNILKTSLQEKINLFNNTNNEAIKNLFWDHLVIENLERLSININIIDSEDWFEIDDKEDILFLLSKLNTKHHTTDAL